MMKQNDADVDADKLLCQMTYDSFLDCLVIHTDCLVIHTFCQHSESAPQEMQTNLLRGRRFRACSKADMLSMAEAQAVKSLSKTDLLRVVRCDCKLLMLHLF